MAGHNIKVNIEHFPQLDQAAKLRVQNALHLALENELKAAGHAGGNSAVFGDGSVKGMPAGNIQGKVGGGP